MSARKLVTINDLATQYGKDVSTLARMIKRFKLHTVPVIQNGKACKALAPKEIDKLESKSPVFNLQVIGPNEKTVPDIARERKQDVSGLRKLLIEHKFKIEKRLLNEGGRIVNVLSEEEYKRLKEFPVRVQI